MTYENNRANLFELNGHKVLLNIQHSSIGYQYPRLFIEQAQNLHLNLDLYLGACFKMSDKDWADWLSDCETVQAEEARECLKGYVNWEAFEQMLASM